MATAFVLSGGASLGAIQVGMLQALAERGVKPDLLVGTSVGAFNAAWLAGRPDGLEELARIWGGLRREMVFPVGVLSSVLALSGRRNYLASTAGLRRMMESHLSFRRLEEAPIPITVVATDVATGREAALSRGDAVTAILASSAIPGVFPPVRFGRRELIDGGVSDHTPIAEAVALGAETVYVLPTGYACALPKAPTTALGMVLHALTLLIQRRLIADVEEYQTRCDLRVLPPLCPLDVAPSDFSRSAELIRRAHRATVDWLARPRRSTGQAALLGFHAAHRRRE